MTTTHADFETVVRNVRSGQMLAEYAARHGGQPRIGCSLIAHRDLGFCAACPDRGYQAGTGEQREIAGWRLLAMRDRGIPRQPWEPSENGTPDGAS